MYLEIDYFKNINDSFGHAIGDLAIKQLTDIFFDSIRDSDILGRIGGDEFGIVLLESNLEKATQIAEKLRLNVEQFVCSGELSEVKFSVCVGVASLISSDANAYDTLKRADINMYISKETGRNTVVGTEKVEKGREYSRKIEYATICRINRRPRMASLVMRVILDSE